MLIEMDKYIAYDVELTRCPYCGSTSQEVSGAMIKEKPEKWLWNVKCNSCRATTGGRYSEREAIAAWEVRYKANEVEQDGYSTWGFDSWLDCLDRYMREGFCRISGTDRSDSGSASDAGTDPGSASGGHQGT